MVWRAAGAHRKVQELRKSQPTSDRPVRRRSPSIRLQSAFMKSGLSKLGQRRGGPEAGSVLCLCSVLCSLDRLREAATAAGAGQCSRAPAGSRTLTLSGLR